MKHANNNTCHTDRAIGTDMVCNQKIDLDNDQPRSYTMLQAAWIGFSSLAQFAQQNSIHANHHHTHFLVQWLIFLFF